MHESILMHWPSWEIKLMTVYISNLSYNLNNSSLLFNPIRPGLLILWVTRWISLKVKSHVSLTQAFIFLSVFFIFSTVQNGYICKHIFNVYQTPTHTHKQKQFPPCHSQFHCISIIYLQCLSISPLL